MFCTELSAFRYLLSMLICALLCYVMTPFFFPARGLEIIEYRYTLWISLPRKTIFHPYDYVDLEGISFLSD